MDISEEDRKQIMASLLDAIAKLSDEEYLQKAWIEVRSPEDYDEFANNYLHEFESIVENYKYFGLTEFQLEKWKNFYDSYNYFFENYKYQGRAELFINSPEWREIMSLAREVLKAFNYQRKPYTQTT